MKKIIYFSIISLILVTACDEEFLEINPLSINTPENVYVDYDGMEAVLLSLRRHLREDVFGDDRTNLMFDLIHTDIASETRQGDYAGQRPLRPEGGAYKIWRDAHNGIRDANVVISRIEVPEWRNEAERNMVLGEAYWHRAYWYYRLVNLYGDVPFIGTEVTAPKIDFVTNTRRSILEKLEVDLEFAADWLREVVEPGMINKAAGQILLTKVYLANGKFSEAIATASALINDPRYSLMTERFGAVAGNPHFNVLWDLHQQDNKSIAANTEMILAVQAKEGFPSSMWDGDGVCTMRLMTPWWSHGRYLPDANGVRQGVDTKGDPQMLALGRGGGHFARPVNYFNYEGPGTLWENKGADLRHDADTNWFPTSKLYVNNPSSEFYLEPMTKEYANPWDTLQAWFPWPYYKLNVRDEFNKPFQPRGGQSDMYVYRLAEAYLLRAEAYVYTDQLALAAADINEVRERALAPPVSVGDVDLEYVVAERARELYYEEYRKTELGRISFILAEHQPLGMGYSMANFHENNFWYDLVMKNNTWYTIPGLQCSSFLPFTLVTHMVLWPIPQNTIDINAGAQLNQNLGYDGAENNVAPSTDITDNDT